MMTKLSLLTISLTALLFASCGREYEVDCIDPQIETAFINYAKPDIDTFILRKFKAADNYQTLLDSFTVAYGWAGYYTTLHDTTSIYISGDKGIKAGFDWQIFIPALNKTVLVSDIVTEKKTGTCKNGIFSLDKMACGCANRVYSAKINNQVVNFPDSTIYTIYIR